MMKNNKKKGLSARVTYALFTVIPVCLYTFFYVGSVINGIGYSFTNWDGIARDFQFIGAANYIRLFKNPYFWNALSVTIQYSAMLVIGVIVTALILALSLNSLRILKTLVKSVYFVPAMIGGVTISLIWDQLYYRVIPLIGQAVGIGWLSSSLLANEKTALPAVVFVQLWQAVALPTVIFIAGLQQIPDEQIESAKMDGATALQRFRFIVIPYLMPMITVNMILTIKQGFTSFDFPYTLTGGGPVRATQVIGILIYDDAYQNMRFSTSNAEACILLVIVAVFSIAQLKITGKGGVDQ